MSDLTTFNMELLDDNGYPTDEILELIPGWTGTPRSLVEDVLVPIFAQYGRVEHTEFIDHFKTPHIRVDLSTGGWSGNEDTISVLQQGLFWRSHWQSSERGGGYTFTIPHATWERTMFPWPKVPSSYEQGWNHAAHIALIGIEGALGANGDPSAVVSALTRAQTALKSGPPNET